MLPKLFSSKNKSVIKLDKLFFGLFIFVFCFFLDYQTIFAQNLETQYRAALNKGRPNKAGKLAYQIGQGYYKEGNENEAINYLNKAYSHSIGVKDYENLGRIYSLLGGIYKGQRKYDLAISNYDKASQAYSFLGDKKKVANAYYLESILYAEAKQYDKAVVTLKKTITTANEANAGDLVLSSTEYLLKIYRIKGETANANLYKEVVEELKNPATEVANLEEQKDKVLEDSSSVTKTELEQKKKVAANITQQQKVKQLTIEELLAKSALESDSLTMLYTDEIASIKAEKKNREKFFVIIVSGVALIAILLIIFVIIQSKTVKAKKKANKELASANYELAAKNEEIEQQKEMIEREKERSDILLLNILPREIAEELKHNSEVRPRSYDQATVIFTDFKGFTQAAELLTPEELINELAECFSEFDTICERWNLERIKTIGDAYMCAGGVPTPNYTNPVDAVSAAMEMQEVIEQLKQKKILQGKPYFEMRLGIHTGAVVAGVVGKKRFAYDIWGDTVNLAARMESSGEIGRVNISEYTYSLVRDYFFCSYRGKVEAKNKGEVDMYFVVSKF